jgi:hypothetical protein
VPTAIGQQIEDALLARLQAVAFSGIDAASVVARALPHLGESLDPTGDAVILAAADADEDGEELGTEDWLSVCYPFEVAVVLAKNRDLGAMPDARLLRQQARRAFGRAGRELVQSAVPGVYRVEPPANGRLFDRGLLAEQYLYCAFVVRVFACEPGS